MIDKQKEFAEERGKVFGNEAVEKQNQKSHTGIVCRVARSWFSPPKGIGIACMYHIVGAFLRAQIIAISESDSIFAFAFECIQPNWLKLIQGRWWWKEDFPFQITSLLDSLQSVRRAQPVHTLTHAGEFYGRIAISLVAEHKINLNFIQRQVETQPMK